MQIRKMIKSDIPAILALEIQIFPDPWPATAFTETLEFEGGGGMIVETDRDVETKTLTKPEVRTKPTVRTKPKTETIGYACYYSAAEETHITNIAVVESYRRKRVANRLLEAIFAEANMAKSEAVFLETRESSAGAQKLYFKNGFKELYRRKRYYSNPTEDAIVFVKNL